MEKSSLRGERITATSRYAFAISEANGDIDPGTQAGFYSSDTRFLSSFILRFNGAELHPVGVDTFGFPLVSFYTVPNMDGSLSPVSIVRDRLVAAGLHEDLYVMSHLAKTNRMRLELAFDADFADIFEVRRGHFEIQRTSLKASGPKEVLLSYNAKKFRRETTITFSKEPKFEGRNAIFEFELKPQKTWNVCINILPTINSVPVKMACVKTVLDPPFGHDRTARSGSIERLKRGPLDTELPMIETENADLAFAFDQCLDDLRALQMEALDGKFVLAAGLPWFMALFGRDSIISAIQSKLLGQSLMIQTLEVLSHFQATRSDKFREAEPGKIPHEIRRGKLSSEEKIPHSNYYGSIDATPLFIMLLSEAYRWTGDAELIEQFLQPAESALTWISEYGDIDGDGFTEYSWAPNKKANEKKFGLRNKGWKDSDDSVSFHDGTLAESPIALAEVQGYVYSARIRMAELCEVLGNEERAIELRREAQKLKTLFNDKFWMQKEGYYAMALDGGKEQVDTITSNVGHCLWTEIVDREKAASVVRRLVSEDMFNGWGIRTLSAREVRYNPLSYHNGSVWPHDTSIAAAGIARYGFLTEANHICWALLEAAMKSHDRRLPELFGGYPRREGSSPVPYPGANRPQAWASGAFIYCLETLLGVMPKGDHLLLEARMGEPYVALKGVAYRGSRRTI